MKHLFKIDAERKDLDFFSRQYSNESLSVKAMNSVKGGTEDGSDGSNIIPPPPKP